MLLTCAVVCMCVQGHLGAPGSECARLAQPRADPLENRQRQQVQDEDEDEDDGWAAACWRGVNHNGASDCAPSLWCTHPLPC